MRKSLKSKSLKLLEKFLNYVLQWYLTGDLHLFLKLDVNTKLKKTKSKKKKWNDRTLSTSKTAKTVFDHQPDITKEHNQGTFLKKFLSQNDININLTS